MTENSPLGSQGSPLGTSDERAATADAVRSMFDQVAPRYDFLNHFLSLGRDVAWRKATARALREALARPESVAVDACCGTGDLALALSRYSAGTVIGTDFSKPMLRRAQAKAHRWSRPVIFVEADTLALPFREGSLDIIGVAFGFRNLAHYGAGLREMHRVLKPGGLVAILEFSRVRWPLLGALFRFYFHHLLPRLGTWISGVAGPYQYLPESVSRFPDQEELAAALRDSGFANVRYRNFAGGIAALHLGEKV
jgi:demethylmenaquinone methyltransferase/2-methoxy-6-polyprenyl-1,4-benzoquinol methylase